MDKEIGYNSLKIKGGSIGSDVAIMFSGGLDSTLAVTTLVEYFERLHLLTYFNGFCINVYDGPKKRVEELSSRYGANRFVHKVIYTTEVFTLFRQDFVENLRRYNSPLIFDLACRLSMETNTALYCLENGIDYACDGTSSAQPLLFMEHPDYLKQVIEFMKGFKIRYFYPVYGFGKRRDRRAKLKLVGIKGREIGLITFLQEKGLFPQISEQILRQPLCYAQFPIFIMTSPIRNLPFIRRFQLPNEDAIKHRHELEKIARDWIEKRLKEKGLDLEKVVEERNLRDGVEDIFPEPSLKG